MTIGEVQIIIGLVIAVGAALYKTWHAVHEQGRAQGERDALYATARETIAKLEREVITERTGRQDAERKLAICEAAAASRAS